MPSVSKKQHNLMAMVANDPAAAKRLGISQSVGKDFVKADKGRTFKKAEGGMAESKKMMAKEVAFMKKKGAPKSIIKHEEAEMKNAKKMAVGGMGNAGGAMRGLDRAAAMSGRAMPTAGIGMRPAGVGGRPIGVGRPAGVGMRPEEPVARPAGMKKGGATKVSKMGSVRTAAPSRDGIAMKGKTDGKKVVMAGSSRGLKKGGKC